MEISLLTSDSLKISGKKASLIVDPSLLTSVPKSIVAKMSADAVVLLNTIGSDSDAKKIEGNRLIIEGPGEYEIAGIKVTGIGSSKSIAYSINIDNVIVLMARASTLSKGSEKLGECHIAVVHSDTELNQTAITALTPRVLLLYGDGSVVNARAFGKDTSSTVQKYQTTLEKLPEEMEVIVLQ